MMKSKGVTGAKNPNSFASGGALSGDWNNDNNSAGTGSILSRAFTPGADWPDKDELLDVVYWSRQGFSAILGMIWGIIPFHGLLAIVLYVVISTIIGHLYVTVYQKVDEDTVGGFWELAKEGFGSGIASFLIAWIIMYSALNSYENL